MAAETEAISGSIACDKYKVRAGMPSAKVPRLLPIEFHFR